jgi:hypothetical protein
VGPHIAKDDDVFLNAPASENIGDIVIKIWRASHFAKHHRNPLKVSQFQQPEVKVHERSKKAFVHRVTWVFLMTINHLGC